MIIEKTMNLLLHSESALDLQILHGWYHPMGTQSRGGAKPAPRTQIVGCRSLCCAGPMVGAGILASLRASAVAVIWPYEVRTGGPDWKRKIGGSIRLAASLVDTGKLRAGLMSASVSGGWVYVSPARPIIDCCLPRESYADRPRWHGPVDE